MGAHSERHKSCLKAAEAKKLKNQADNCTEVQGQADSSEAKGSAKLGKAPFRTLIVGNMLAIAASKTASASKCDNSKPLKAISVLAFTLGLDFSACATAARLAHGTAVLFKPDFQSYASSSSM